VPAGVKEAFLPAQSAAQPGERLVYRAFILGTAKLHFVDAKAQVDVWEDTALIAPLADGAVLWDDAGSLDPKTQLAAGPEHGGAFDTLPAAASQAKNYAAWSSTLADTLYRTRTLDLRRCPALRLVGRAGESEGEFKARVALAARESRDTAIEALRTKYAAKLEAIASREQRAADKVGREQAQVSQQMMQTAISVGATVLGAFFGRKAISSATLGRASTAARGVSRTLKERGDVGGASESLEAVRARRAEIEAELQGEIDRLTDASAPDRLAIETTSVRPRKLDIEVSSVSLAWVPHWIGDGGGSRPAR
jgi:hypothetical protein